MKICVTGGSGFIGSSLVNSLVSSNYEVTVMDIFEPNNKDALLLMASVDYARASFQSGLQHAEMALALYPADPWCYLLVARGYRYSGILDLAEMQILSGLEFTLVGSNQYRLLCVEASAIYLALGREKEAELWLDKADQ